jgi:hypothetical protein
VVTAALGSSFAFITKTMTSLSWTQVVLGLLGAAVVVMLPVTLVASLKLARQDLSALLEGCGWAINGRMRLTGAQRRSFTRTAPFPRDAEGTPRHRWWRTVAIVILAGAVTWGGVWAARRHRAAHQDPVPPAAPAGEAGGGSPASPPPPA